MKISSLLQIIKKYIFLIFFLFCMTFILFKGFSMHNLASSIYSTDFSVHQKDNYNYSEVKFPRMDLSSIPNIYDYDNDGIANSLDMVHGARIFIDANPIYESGYYQGGYPPLGTGVCTDVIAYAFLHAGYNLRDMVDQDIRENRSLYKDVYVVDKNIDYRRVKNLVVFFDRYATSLTTKVEDPSDWQVGDILVFPQHIGMLSDKKNERGYPYIIHHGGKTAYEEDVLENSTILRHYRFAA